MSDPNKFINTYIDTITATLHEYLGSSLQLKTQLKLANDLLQERDKTIASISEDLELLKQGTVDKGAVAIELASCRDKLKIAEDSHNALKVKVSHIDTMTNQITEMKRDIVSKNETIASQEQVIKEQGDTINVISLNAKTQAEKIVALEADITAKDNEIADLKSKLEAVSAKKPTSSSAVKVQLNTKNKAKELPIDTDDF